MSWHAAVEDAPSLAVTAEVSGAIQLELRALLGGLSFTWTQEAWVSGATTEAFDLRLPAALLEHPAAPGVPLVVVGVARTEHELLAVPTLYATVEIGADGPRLRAIERTRSIPYRAELYPGRSPHRAREGRDVDDASSDTGLSRDGGAR